MYNDVVEWVKTCDECQKRAKRRFAKPLHPTWSITVWEKVRLDVIYMPWKGKDGYIVMARDDLSGYVEGRVLEAANSLNVARFLQEEVVCHHGVPKRIVLDGGAENLKFTQDLLKKYGIHGVYIAPYHPESNGLVERGHQTIFNAIAKYRSADNSKNQDPRITDWTRYLSLALWADRITVRWSTGYSAFEVIYGRECLLPVQLAIDSWSTIDWDGIKDREELIMARMKQLDERQITETQAAENLRRSRIQNKAYFDSTRRLRPRELQDGNLVLAFKVC